MANIHDCLQSAIDAGDVDRTRGEAAQSEYAQLVERFSSSMGPAQAEAAAARAVKEASQTRAAERRHKVIAQVQALTRVQQQIEQSSTPHRVLKLLMEYDEGAEAAGFTGESVRSVHDALVKSVNFGIQDALTSVGRDMLGRARDPALLRNIISELHGDASGNVNAKQIADGVRAQQERLRQLFNAHGGNIGRLEDFGVSHSHNVSKLRKAGFDAWAQAVTPRLAWDRIVDHQTGRPFSTDGSAPAADVVERFLRDVFAGITTRGWDMQEPSMSIGGRALYNTRAEHRVLHFKSGDDWMNYNEAFGQADPFTSMVGGLHGMARDIAQMRVLGPNPRLTLEFAEQVARRRVEIAGDEKAARRLSFASAKSKAMLAHISGAVNQPVDDFWASFFGGTRQVLTSIQLGSAPISAVTDQATIGMASKVMGLNPGNVYARQMKLLANSGERDMMAASGYVADGLADMGAAQARYTGDTYAPEIAERLAGFTMRASGLSFLTDMSRIAFQGELTGFMATQAARTLEELPAELQQLFRRRGITAADWDALRDADTLYRPKDGVAFLNPFYWLERTSMPRAEAEGLAMRLQMAIEEQLEFAVPTASLEGRALTIWDTKPGAPLGEVARSLGMYKSFALSLTLGQIRRYNSLPTTLDRLGYAAMLGSSLILLGGLAVQLKELVKGNDPRPMDEGKFWMAALFQGGGLGIFGDFFSSETSRMGGGLSETIAGPVAGFAGDVVGLVAGNVSQAVAGEDMRLGRDITNFIRYNTPVASSLWYSRLAYDRGVADQLQAMLDPEANQAWRQQQQRRDREFGNQTWWERGDLAPTRGPDLSNIVGNQ